jgi:hypothetical protein
MAYFDSETRQNGGVDAPVPLQFLAWASQLFIPGVLYKAESRPGLLWGFVGLMLLGSAASALVCFVVPGRFAFTRARRLGWAFVGLLFGPVGLLLMTTLLEWPVQVACPMCRKLRVVTREHCEHCHAEHAPPVTDGTEIFEPVNVMSEPALATSLGGHL